MAETETINKIVIEIGGVDYEFSGGGGGIPAPDSVGTEQIKDGAVEMEDLHDDVVGKMTNTYNKGNETLTLGSLNVTQPMVVEEEEP